MTTNGINPSLFHQHDHQQEFSNQDILEIDIVSNGENIEPTRNVRNNNTGDLTKLTNLDTDASSAIKKLGEMINRMEQKLDAAVLKISAIEERFEALTSPVNIQEEKLQEENNTDSNHSNDDTSEGTETFDEEDEDDNADKSCNDYSSSPSDDVERERIDRHKIVERGIENLKNELKLVINNFLNEFMSKRAISFAELHDQIECHKEMGQVFTSQLTDIMKQIPKSDKVIKTYSQMMKHWIENCGHDLNPAKRIRKD